MKNLNLSYQVKQMERANRLSYLHCLSKPETFRWSTALASECWQQIRFPHSLKKLSITASSKLDLEGIMLKIGSLPLLEKFILEGGSFRKRQVGNN